MKYLQLILLVIFATNLDIYIFRAGYIGLRPTDFLIPLFFAVSLIPFPVKSIFNNFKTHTFKYLFLFCVLSILYSINSDVTFDAMLTALVNSFITLLFYLFAFTFFSKVNHKFISILFLSSILILGLSIWYDTLIGLNVNYLNIRKGGFSENPNTGAAALNFLGLSTLILIRNNKLRLLILLGLFATTFITFSRGGILLLIILSFLLIINKWQSYFNFKLTNLISTALKLISLIVLLYFIIISIAGFIQSEIPGFAEGSMSKRMDFFLAKDDQSVSVNDFDTNGRGEVALYYLNIFEKNPFGNGTGYSTDPTINKAVPHNFLLLAAVNYGFIGLLILLWFLFYSFSISIKKDNFYYFIFSILLLLYGFLSNDMFVERPILIVLAFMDSNLYNKTLET